MQQAGVNQYKPCITCDIALMMLYEYLHNTF